MSVTVTIGMEVTEGATTEVAADVLVASVDDPDAVATAVENVLDAEATAVEKVLEAAAVVVADVSEAVAVALEEVAEAVAEPVETAPVSAPLHKVGPGMVYVDKDV